MGANLEADRPPMGAAIALGCCFPMVALAASWKMSGDGHRLALPQGILLWEDGDSQVATAAFQKGGHTKCMEWVLTV